MSDEAVKQVSTSEVVDQNRIPYFSTGGGTLETSSEKLAEDNTPARNEAGRMSNFTTSASVPLTAATNQVLGDTRLATVSDLYTSQITKHKRGRASSVDELSPPPPPKKLAGDSLSAAEPVNQAEVDSIAEASVGLKNLSPATTIVGENGCDTTTYTPYSRVQASGMMNDGEDDSGGGMNVNSETIIQPPAIDSETKKATKLGKTTPHLNWYEAKAVFADGTLINKICAPGMEEFLRWEGVDLDKEFPRRGGKYTNAEGERINRSTALKNKVQKMHQAYIDARSVGIRDVPQGWTGKGFEHEEPSSPAPASAGISATVSGKKRQSARKTRVSTPKDEGDEVVSQTRTDLQAIHRYAAEQLSKAYEQRVQDVAADEGENSKISISAKVDRLVFDIVDCHIRLRMVRMRQEHGADTEEDLAGITSEMHKRRAELIMELQHAVKWAKGQDPVLLACQLVLQEFPANV